MVAFYLLEKRPLPDLITTIPLPLLRKLERGYNQSELLAQEVATFLKRPYHSLLKTYWYNPPSATLSAEERQKRENPFFIKRRPANITQKTVLLIDDVITTGATLQNAALALQELNPLKLYALSFCRSE
jgi:ComF family protein